MKRFEIVENNLTMVWGITDEDQVCLLHFSSLPFDESSVDEKDMGGFRILELAVSGVDRPLERHGIKYTVTGPAYRMTYRSHKDYRNEWGRKLEIVTEDRETGISAVSHFQFYDGIPMARCFSEIKNEGGQEQGIEYVSSFNINGIEKEGLLPQDKKMKVHIIHNSWQREVQWKEYSLADLGIEQSQSSHALRSSKAIGVSNTGNWSTKEYLPMGAVVNEETGSRLFWQIENNGSWHWEISDQTNHLYLQLSGPTENQSHWYKVLKPGDVFCSVPVAIGSVTGTVEAAVDALTAYRRRTRRENEDNKKLSVVFNDYMNCLWAEPTTEKEKPLIDAAAEVGCEYYCIDAGWYADGYWWDGVGEWQPKSHRFSDGLQEVLNYIRAKGMIPGLWLELEVMGIKSNMLDRMPDDAYFVRHGRRVFDRSRYQLDFRNPHVIAHATEVVTRLVEEYGIGYIKMDYNIEPGIGTELYADSFGDGLLEHERAYLSWLDNIFAKYPDLVIENCSSGGLRMDYALLSRHSLQSTSDQEDYQYYATIAANAPLAVTMEQAGVWSSPREGCTDEEIIFSMVNSMLMRIHQSGRIDTFSTDQRQLVKDAIDVYKTIRKEIVLANAFWPLGFANFEDDWLSLGIRCDQKNYIAVWRRSGAPYALLPIKHLKRKAAKARCIYPLQPEKQQGAGSCSCEWNPAEGIFSVCIPTSPAARLFEIIEE